MTRTIRVGVVEDAADATELLLGHLARYEREHDVRFAVRTWTDGAQLVDDYRADLDLLLLDVEMPGLDGLEAARHVRTLDADVVIVFITNSAQYAVRGYEVDALSYLLKPVPYVQLAQQLRRSLDRVRRAGGDALTLQLPAGIARVDLADVLYVESIRHRVVVHAVDREYALTGTLKSFEADLAGKGFFRSNNCYLVNLRHVTAVDGTDAVLLGGRALAISRPRRKAFLEALTDHLGRS